MIKSKHLFLGLSLISMFHVSVYAGAPTVFSKAGRVLFWVVRPFEVLDTSDPSFNNKYGLAKQKIEDGLNSFQDDDKNYCFEQFDSRYRMRWKYRHMKPKKDASWKGEENADYKWTVMNGWKYGPLCDCGRNMTRFIHRKRNAYALSGLWYVVLAAGTACVIQKVVSSLKKRKKIREKQKQERFAHGCAVPVQV